MAISENVDPIAIVEFVCLGGVPQESAAGLRFLSDQIVDLQFGPVVDAAHGIVHKDNLRVRAQRPGK